MCGLLKATSWAQTSEAVRSTSGGAWPKTADAPAPLRPPLGVNGPKQATPASVPLQAPVPANVVKRVAAIAGVR
jgi:hypothetical protein